MSTSDRGRTIGSMPRLHIRAQTAQKLTFPIDPTAFSGNYTLKVVKRAAGASACGVQARVKNIFGGELHLQERWHATSNNVRRSRAGWEKVVKKLRKRWGKH